MSELSIYTLDIRLFAFACITAAFATVFLRSWQRQSHARLPGYIGDKEDVGAILKSAAIAKQGPWEVFDQLAKKYGLSF